jgi:hypothetical protein
LTLVIVLPYLRQELVFDELCTVDNGFFPLGKVGYLALAIRRHPTVKEFDAGFGIPSDTLHIILSALATLPSLEVARLGLEASEWSYSEHPEALKELMLSPSLRKVYFDYFTFCRPLCQALEEALQGESKIVWLSLDNCSIPEDAGDRVARALRHNTTLTTVRLSGNFPQTFYDAFAVVLLLNTTHTNLELSVPDNESQAAFLVPVFLALGMNKVLKKLEISQFSPGVVPLHLAMRDGLKKNSALEILQIFTFRAEEFSTSLLSTLLPFLRVSTSSTTLKYLKIKFELHSFTMTNPHVATSCLAIVTVLRETCLAFVTALPENSSLETLEIFSGNGIAPDTYMTALESLQMNTTLKKLCLSPAFFGNDEMKRMVSLVKKNYVLIELDEDVSTQDKTGEIHAILRLNKAGRRYLIDDAGSIPNGVEVLIDVRDDLGCLF